TSTGAMPLVNKFLAMFRERNRQRLLKNRHRAVKTIPKCYADREIQAASKVDFADHGHIAVLGLLEFPVQMEILMKVLPSVAMSDVSTRSFLEPDISPHRKEFAGLPR